MSDELSKNDLFILMESYKNNIQLNTTLLEQQKQLMTLNIQSIEKQNELCKHVDGIIDKMSNLAIILSENNSKLSKEITLISTEVSKEVNSISEEINNIGTNLSKEHDKLNFKMWLAFGAMTSTLVAFIYFGVELLDKYSSVLMLVKNHIGG